MGNNPSFKEIPNGMPGLHWRLPIILNKVLRKQCNLDLHDFIRITSTMPAKIYGLYPKKGEIRIGSDADITIWNKDKNFFFFCKEIIKIFPTFFYNVLE